MFTQNMSDGQAEFCNCGVASLLILKILVNSPLPPIIHFD